MKKLIRLSSLIALAIVLSIFESFFPIFNIPGVKLGLANIVIITTLYIYGFKDALFVSLIRVLFVSILKAGLFSLYFSIAGSILSIISMYIFKKTKLSIIGVSIIGSIFHIIGQILVAILLLNTNLLYYLPYMILISIITGIIIGYISKENIKYLKNNM